MFGIITQKSYTFLSSAKIQHSNIAKIKVIDTFNKKLLSFHFFENLNKNLYPIVVLSTIPDFLKLVH